ncbi:hypothetical protein [Carboxydothermus ferrireducens]|uniref:Uncharacterized protein n=1 Tax=Carboxydothermus ferrireducens DSM 11255 TaxID=1119529 RepID=A0ABX2R7N8_9THEO|nr:hypothetical protein [Carboxydothermus ferrireducens]NYE57182.1 hypothetical protein [Carboxydothermus ferrireducens DSM 11255]
MSNSQNKENRFEYLDYDAFNQLFDENSIANLDDIIDFLSKHDEDLQKSIVKTISKSGALFEFNETVKQYAFGFGFFLFIILSTIAVTAHTN